eukprot:Colp12_sorted_trinity150504_noHs@5418
MSNPRFEFTSYEKIVEDSSRWTITPAVLRSFSKTQWVVTEKIHGSNFCIMCDGNEITFAKRTGILSKSEDFYGYKRIAHQLENGARAIHAIITSKIPTKFISIYGELFGGEYPHPDVPVIPNLQAVQTGVYYSPDIHFCVFDIATISPDGVRSYLDFEEYLRGDKKGQDKAGY